MNRCTLFIASIALVFATTAKTNAQSIAPQDLERLKKMEDSLVVTADSMYAAFLPDTRLGYCERFVKQLVRALKIENSYLYGFDSLKQVINILHPDDNAFRMFNWAIESGNIPKRYYGAIQFPQPKLKLIGLNDYTEQLDRGLEDSLLTGGKWFGALYYRIMLQVVNGKKVYTCFGLNTASPISNRKVLDPMHFDEKTGGVIFGHPIFAVASRSNSQQKVLRFVLEYKKSVSATMNWNLERQMIIFDHLESLSNDPTRRYTYVPTGQYDGLIWADNLWHVKKGVMQVTILEDGQAPDE